MKKLVLSFMVCVFGLLMTDATSHATSHSLYISEIKLGGAVAGQPTEYVEIFNDSDAAINLDEFHLEYAKSTSTIIEAQCTSDLWEALDTSSNVKMFGLSGLIQPRGRLVFTASLNDNLAASLRLAKYQDTESLLEVLDVVGWGDTAICKEGESATLPPNGMSIKRLFNADGHPIDTNNNKSDFSAPQLPFPEEDDLPEQSNPEPEPVEAACSNTIILSEFLTDPDGLESNGGEFIELHNTSPEEVSLQGCVLKSSKSATGLIDFSAADKIPTNGYFVINLTDKLVNASGSITLLSADREDVVNYTSLKEGESFALINGQWQVTDRATPGEANQLLLLDEEAVAVNDGQQLTPCPAGKYRSPETNRCRSIELTANELTPCDPGETRSPETNRCRKVALASASLAACDEGEERNPATNRCRKVVATSSDLKPCEEGYERNPATNRCRKVASVMGAANSLAATDEPVGGSKIDMRIILVVLILTSGYGVYEYRADIKNLYERIIAKFSKTGPPG